MSILVTVLFGVFVSLVAIVTAYVMVAATYWWEARSIPTPRTRAIDPAPELGLVHERIRWP
ncbi:hypothetical protein [Nocardia jejuensis]|uniref:hypothetical protein n=1 Tax=Nocardia jejuensis TaxID=328049 RepID=UPI000AAC6879|nr:hypothetical protein [Nocardia jejuensis]